jgi:hypothetical protein
MVPQTVMVAPEGVQYERIPAQYGTREHVEMVAPARTCLVRRAAIPAATDTGFGGEPSILSSLPLMPR